MSTAQMSTADAARDGGPDPQHLRRVLGHVPTGVCVVTTTRDGMPVGSTVGSFTSVSLDPPLIAFFSKHSSDVLAAIRRQGSFAVNVLAADQPDVCQVFARKGVERFEQVRWQLGPRQHPHLHQALAVLECDVETVADAGDHAMVLGRVRQLEVLRPAVGPLVFWTGALHGIRSLSAIPN